MSGGADVDVQVAKIDTIMELGAKGACSNPSYQLFPLVLPPGLTVAEMAADLSAAGGAQSGKSETITDGGIMLNEGGATAAAAPAAAAAAASPAAEVQLTAAPAAAECADASQGAAVAHAATAPASPASAAAPAAPPADDPVPLPPPDASEGPEAAAEYELYVQRWEAGDTLAQRWHRLAVSGKLDTIRGDWEDMQLDLMLQQVKARTQQALTQSKAAAGGGLICATRLRRGRGEVEEAADSPNEEPRRVRSRRAPSTLQDYHVENNNNGGAPAAAATNKGLSSRTPEAFDPAGAAAAAAAATAQPAGRQRQQLLLPSHQAAAEAASEESTDEAADNVTFIQHAAGSQMQYVQQHQQGRVPGRRGPLPQQPPKRVVTRVQRSSAAPQQQQQSRQFNRVITPYNPQLHQQQMHHVQHDQQQQQHMLAGVSPEMLEEFYKMGSRLGAAFNHTEGDTAAGLAQNPAAMAAFMHTLYQYGANPTAFAQQVASMMGGGGGAGGMAPHQ